MDLYIEKEFLDNFYIDFTDEPINQIVGRIIWEYGDKRVFIDYEEKDFLSLKLENKFFAQIGNILPPIPIASIQEYLFEKSNFEQTIVFMNEEKSWFKQAQEKGGLCFSFDNYKNKIEDIINFLHFRIDLSEGFKGWEFLSKYECLNFNEIIITDGYILSDKSGQKVNDNIIPILEALTFSKTGEINIDIFTKELNPISNTEEHKKEKAKKKYQLLNRFFSKQKLKFKIVMSDVENDNDFHDRVIQTNFSLLESGKGFNLSHAKKSNSQITSETIFEKYTYNRLKSHKRMQKAYRDKLERLDTMKFKIYPA